MVKGMSRQVIVVPSPDPKLFEQAIFILRDDALGKNGQTDRAILQEARRAASSYVAPGKRRRTLPPLSWAALGAAAMGLIWLLTAIL